MAVVIGFNFLTKAAHLLTQNHAFLMSFYYSKYWKCNQFSNAYYSKHFFYIIMNKKSKFSNKVTSLFISVVTFYDICLYKLKNDNSNVL